MAEDARTWLSNNFLCTDAEPEQSVRVLADNTEGFSMAPQLFISRKAEDTFWMGTAVLSIPGLRILEDGKGACMLQLPVDAEEQKTCLAALYGTRCKRPVPVCLRKA